jgi:hypothetical protein
MSYETDTLLNQARTVFSQAEHRTMSIETRLYELELKLKSFMDRAEPFIKTMELIGKDSEGEKA